MKFSSGTEVLLISSRETGRWVIPKGWPKILRTFWRSAEIEASEEAGIIGKIRRKAIGEYKYLKRLGSGKHLTCTVKVFPLEVSAQRLSWPERNQRKILWLPLEEAAKHVEEPGLAELIRTFSD